MMRQHLMAGFALCLVGTSACASRPAIRATDVVVLSTLHGLHETQTGYAYGDLGATLDCLSPDVLAVELTAQDLAARTAQAHKREYQEVVFPYLDRTRIPAVALEPEEPRSSGISKPYTANQKAVAADEPARHARFSAYADAAYVFLTQDHWSSVLRVNDATTDAIFEAKHAAQEAHFGLVERENWAAWNAAFLERIRQAAEDRPSARIVVLVGAEHGYWLRERLAKEEALNLVPLDEEALAACAARPQGSFLGRGG